VLLQVWNQNAVTGMVGVFHLQGSSWDRTKRRFYIHSRRNPPLSTAVTPHHVHSFAVQDATAAAAGGSGGVGRRYACYCYSSGRLQVLEGGDAVNVELTAAKADLYWFTPVQSARDVDFAPVGLTNMYNGGGAIQSVAVLAGQEAAAVSAGKVSSPPAAALANGNSSSNGSSSSSGLQKQPHHPGVVASVAVRGCGRLLMYCSRRPASVWINLAPRDFDYNEYTCALEVEVPQLQELHSEVLVML
jgi:raffinose synthase